MTIPFGAILSGLGAGAKSLDTSNRRKREEEQLLEDRLARKEEIAQRRMLEEAIQGRAAESHRANMQSRTLEDALKQAQIDQMRAPKPQKPKPSRNTDRGIEEFDEATGQWTPTGRKPYQAPSQRTDEPPKPAEFEKKAAFMIEGAERANQVLSNYRPSARSFVSKVPGLGNYGVSEDEQVALQAAETLHDAYLRLTTGATINPEELRAAARQYVPLPGDKPGVIRAKHQRRAEIVRAMRAAAQPALNQQSRGAAPQRALPNPDY